MARLVLRGGRVFDGTGADPATADVALEGERIVDVGIGLDGDDAVDCTGWTLLPGLFDCHVHVGVSHVDPWRLANTPVSYRILEAARNMAATLRAGITSVRDAGGADLGIQQAQRDRLIEGPRIQISLAMLSQTGGHGDGWLTSGIVLDVFSRQPGIPETIVDGPDEMRRAVRTLIRQGADVIKVATSGGVLSSRDQPTHAHFTADELAVLVEEATAAGVFVMAHAQAAEGIKRAIRAGIRSIEHGIYLDDEGIELMLERGTWLVPTLVAPQGVIDAADAGVDLGPGIAEKARAVVEIHREAFRRAVEAGVRIAMGTDSGVTPHGRNLRELALMAAGGMAPAAVLEATTRSAAQLLGVDSDLGTLEPGKIADLVAVAGDPYELDTLPDRIAGVWQAGSRVA
ncbi:MAG TPA: amidohydrolase family protein [Candidatus Limnocylindrales bacterium]|nr:amidohydrolase family protein [Candidatus Limnocylindrales bacterium]